MVFVVERGGLTSYEHGGGTGGIRAILNLTPVRQAAVVVWTNNDTNEPALLVATAGRPEAPLAAERVAEFAGGYEVDARGRFTVVVGAAGRLRVRLTGQPFLPVFYAGEDRFFARAVAAEFQFERGAEGRVERLTLHQNCNAVPAMWRGEAPRVRFPAAEELAVYEGSYQLAPGLVFDVTRRGAQLVVKLTGQPALLVFATAGVKDWFECDVVEVALEFERDAAGAVGAVVLHQHGAKQRAVRVEGLKD